MTDTFVWKVLATASGGGEFRVSKAQFGDGYAQEAAYGLNNEVQKWNVTAEGYTTQISAPLAFIRAKAGGEAFYWTPPLGVQGYYRCKSYSINKTGGDHYTMSLVFEQAFYP